VLTTENHDSTARRQLLAHRELALLPNLRQHFSDACEKNAFEAQLSRSLAMSRRFIYVLVRGALFGGLFALVFFCTSIASWPCTTHVRPTLMLMSSKVKGFASSFRAGQPYLSTSIRDGRNRSQSEFRSSSSGARAKTVKPKKTRVEIPSSAPERVEKQMSRALASLCDVLKTQPLPSTRSGPSNRADPMETYLFPTTRECNAALASFGDGGDLLRALRLFGRMRKAAVLVQTLPSLFIRNESFPCDTTSYAGSCSPSVPIPTLVTYSTLMSRANSLGKPRVSLRLWKLMIAGATTPSTSNQLVPDTRAVNILLNSYAKLMDLPSARSVLHQMRTGGGPDVKIQLVPNLVTFNTLLDACLKTGDLDAALQAKDDLEALGLQPDTRTYTNLIATVARKASIAAGQNDPTLAFAFLHEMKERGVVPNGMTYSALIDAAGRCQRSDLALQGLRTMLREKSKRIENEVGAWTAAINACGKAGRVDTALRLFYAMPNFQVEPNAVTCGCLTDCLLRAGRTADTLDVLRFMKANGIEPTDVMYTSLMTRAEGLARMESKSPPQRQRYRDSSLRPTLGSETKAIELYTELMSSLVESGRNRQLSRGGSSGKRKDKLLLDVFLVFQEMKASGTDPDLACYNALLRACARAGDFGRAQDVLKQILKAGLEPNDASWRQLIRAASNIHRSDFAIEIWKQGLSFRSRRLVVDEPTMLWKPSDESFGALLLAHLQHAAASESLHTKVYLYGCVLDLFDALLLGDEKLGLNRIDPNLVLESQRNMLLVLQAIVALHDLCEDESKQESIVNMACSILQLDCLQRVPPCRMHWSSHYSYRKALTWGMEALRRNSG
jgi:pentatricopeptide repeat protein